eukprot:2037657-Pyramimonas_sp.AAC.1
MALAGAIPNELIGVAGPGKFHIALRVIPIAGSTRSRCSSAAIGGWGLARALLQRGPPELGAAGGQASPTQVEGSGAEVDPVLHRRLGPRRGRPQPSRG